MGPSPLLPLFGATTGAIALLATGAFAALLAYIYDRGRKS